MRLGASWVFLIAACGGPPAPRAPAEPARVLADGSVELPTATIDHVKVPRGATNQSKVAGLAIAHRCRKPGSGAAPSVALLQSSGDATVDRALLEERMIQPAGEPMSDELRCGYATLLALPQNAAHAPVERTEILATELSTQRVSGDSNIFPADAVKEQFRADRRGQVEVPIKLCVDLLGRVSSVEVLSSSGHLAYDLDLMNAVAAWRYRPFVRDGESVAVCAVVKFLYRQR